MGRIQLPKGIEYEKYTESGGFAFVDRVTGKKYRRLAEARKAMRKRE